MKWIAAILLPACAFAQLQLATLEGTQERSVGGTLALGSVAAGDVRETRFRVRNTGVAAVNWTTLRVGGDRFALGNIPTLPYVIAPGSFADFSVRFSPALPGSYSASLQVNTINVVLLASSQAAAAIAVRENDARRVLTSGDSVAFPRIVRGGIAARVFELGNPGASAVAVNSAQVSGSHFRMAAPLPPLTLAPGEWRSFEVQYVPSASGNHAGQLLVDGRAIALTGSASEPPPPRMTIVVDAAGAASGQQRRASIRFDAPAETDGAGTLELSFRPATAQFPDDPAIRFTTTGSRRASFQYSRGDTGARFGTQGEITFQTGTTAGAIEFRVTGSTATALELQVAMAPAMVSLDSARASRRLNDLDIQFSGFDNTYSAGRFAFTFFDRQGNRLSGAIQHDATSDFRGYFQQFQREIGSAFLVRITFPVSGDAAQIGSVDVEIANAAGTRIERLSFP
ncbi:MAG: choice-of-anchor D domain-containing protein [Bryobacteraceae bacterium]|nr:choice-of-anchor D domain-containing protein [Bryobacteraceae bacterium]